MSKYFNEIKAILESNGEAYETKYPEIRAPNVFSISTLAKSATNQVYWKMKGQKGQFPYESNVGRAFFLGRATHEFIQRRMPYASEYPVFKSRTDFVLNFVGFKLIGHIDNVDLTDNYVLEYKTTKLESVPLCRYREYMLQAGTYAKLLETRTGRKFGASVFVINGTLTEYELTQEDIDNSFEIIMNRANQAYEELRAKGKIASNISAR